MLITTNLMPNGMPVRSFLKSEAPSEVADRAPQDRIDFSDPKEWIPIAGYALAGSVPFVGTIANGLHTMNTENTKTERWFAVAATAASAVGLPLLVTSIISGSPGGIVAGAALTALAGGNFAHEGIKARELALKHRY
jgi:hypothetical protein